MRSSSIWLLAALAAVSPLSADAATVDVTTVGSVPLDPADLAAEGGRPPAPLEFDDPGPAEVTKISVKADGKEVACVGARGANGRFVVTRSLQHDPACQALFSLAEDVVVVAEVVTPPAGNAKAKKATVEVIVGLQRPALGPARRVPLCQGALIGGASQPAACTHTPTQLNGYGYVDLSTELGAAVPILWTTFKNPLAAKDRILTRDDTGWRAWTVEPLPPGGGPATGTGHAYLADADEPRIWTAAAPASSNQLLLVAPDSALEQALASSSELWVPVSGGVPGAPTEYAPLLIQRQRPKPTPAGAQTEGTFGYRVTIAGGAATALPLDTAELTRGQLRLVGATSAKVGATDCGYQVGSDRMIDLGTDACLAALRKDGTATSLIVGNGGVTDTVTLSLAQPEVVDTVRRVCSADDAEGCDVAPGTVELDRLPGDTGPADRDALSVYDPTKGWVAAPLRAITDDRYVMSATTPGGQVLAAAPKRVVVRRTRGGKEVQFAAGEPKSELPDPTGWCTEELFAERVAGLARHADYLLCIDVLTGAPGGVELFRVQSDPIGAHTLFREPEEHGWALEPGRDMVVLLRHEGEATVTSKTNGSLGQPARDLFEASLVQPTGATKGQTPKAEIEDLKDAAVSVFHVAPFSAGSFDVDVAFKRKIAGTAADHTLSIPFLVLKRYHGAVRVGVGMGVNAYRPWGTSAASGQVTLAQEDRLLAGPELVIGYAFFGPRGRLYDARSKPCRVASAQATEWRDFLRCRAHPYIGLAVLGPGATRADGGTAFTRNLALFSSTTLGAEIEAGPHSSIAIGLNLRRVRRPLPGLGSGSVVADLDDATRPGLDPGLSVVVNFSPSFFRVAGLKLF